MLIFGWSCCLVEIMKIKSNQDLFENLWYDLKKLLWRAELNPRVRCAFGNVFTHFLFCNWIEINQVVISYLAAIDTDDRMMTVHGVDRRVAGTLFWSITDLVGNSWSPTIVTDCRSIVPRGNKNLPIHHNFLGDGTSFQRQTLWHWFSSLEFWKKKASLWE